MTDEEIDMLWICRPSIHNGDLMLQLRDFARAVLAEDGKTRIRVVEENQSLKIQKAVEAVMTFVQENAPQEIDLTEAEVERLWKMYKPDYLTFADIVVEAHKEKQEKGK